MSNLDVAPRERMDELQTLSSIAAELGFDDALRDIDDLSRKALEGLFYVACLGQFKRGKSTLLNALVGEAVLPTGVLPVTAVITILRFDAARRVVARFADGHQRSIGVESIADYVTEERNPENEKGVQALEIFLPSPLLRTGMCLVDTPGLGSVFEANTATTRDFLPHIDAALIVLGADPPISGEEAAVVQQIATEVPDIIVVLNKADRLSAAEVDQAVGFARRIISQRLHRDFNLFTVSAAESLLGKEGRDWPALEAKLTSLAHDSGADLVRSSQLRGLRRLCERVVSEIDERRTALTAPIGETEQRVTSLRAAVHDAQRSLRDLSYLFAAEQSDLSRRFEEERDRFVADAFPRAAGKLEEELRRSTRRGNALRDEALRAAQTIAEKEIRTWLPIIEPRAEQMYARSMERFAELANDFFLRLTAPGAEGLADVSKRIDYQQSFRTRRRFFFTDLAALTGRLPGASIVDVLRPTGDYRRKVAADAIVFLRRLIHTNASRIANDLIDRVVESRRSMEQEIRTQLQNVVVSAERAMERARAAHAAGSERVAAEIAQIDEARARVEQMAKSL